MTAVRRSSVEVEDCHRTDEQIVFMLPRMPGCYITLFIARTFMWKWILGHGGGGTGQVKAHMLVVSSTYEQLELCCKLWNNVGRNPSDQRYTDH